MSQISPISDTLSTEKITEIKKAVEKLSSKKEPEKQAARAELERLGANKIEVLLALLNQEAEERRKRHRWVGIGVASYCAIALAFIIVPMLFGGKPITDFFKHFGGMTGLIVVMLAVTSTQKNATRELAEYNDKRTVGAWALALAYDDKEIVATAREKLTQLLPQLNASDADLLDDEQRANLYKALNKPPDKKAPTVDLHRTILGALQQIGDEKALPHVKRLAKGEGLAAKFPELQEAAEECLPYLEQRVEQIRASQTLLRASSALDAPSSGSDILLRPATYSGQTAPQELLRASNAEAPETDEVTAEYAARPVQADPAPEVQVALQRGKE